MGPSASTLGRARDWTGSSPFGQWRLGSSSRICRIICLYRQEEHVAVVLPGVPGLSPRSNTGWKLHADSFYMLSILHPKFKELVLSPTVFLVITSPAPESPGHPASPAQREPGWEALPGAGVCWMLLSHRLSLLSRRAPEGAVTWEPLSACLGFLPGSRRTVGSFSLAFNHGSPLPRSF